MASIYDCYTITVLMTLEDAGFCEKGQGMSCVADHDLTYRGDFPLNTAGGQLSFGQAGMAGGMHHVVDGARQIMGRAGAAQVRRLPHRLRHRQRRHHERAGRAADAGGLTAMTPSPFPSPRRSRGPSGTAWPSTASWCSTRPRWGATSSTRGTLAPGTLADDLEWREIDGAGTLYTFTVARRPTGPPWADALPQLLAVVQWDAGPEIQHRVGRRRPGDVRYRHAGRSRCSTICPKPESRY